MKRYYSTQRPVSPGTYPKPQGNRVLNIENFDCKRYCDEAGCSAWGYIDYEKPVSPVLLENYELVTDRG